MPTMAPPWRGRSPQPGDGADVVGGQFDRGVVSGRRREAGPEAADTGPDREPDVGRHELGAGGDHGQAARDQGDAENYGYPVAGAVDEHGGADGQHYLADGPGRQQCA